MPLTCFKNREENHHRHENDGATDIGQEENFAEHGHGCRLQVPINKVYKKQWGLCANGRRVLIINRTCSVSDTRWSIMKVRALRWAPARHKHKKIGKKITKKLRLFLWQLTVIRVLFESNDTGEV